MLAAMMRRGAGFLRKANSPVKPVSGNGSILGIQTQMRAKTLNPHKPIRKNAVRHESHSVTNVPNGTPIRVATVIPAIMRATALDLRSGGTSLSATIAPTPK